MTHSVSSDLSANILSQLYLQTLSRLGLLERFAKVPFKLQQRRSGHTGSGRCLSLLASLAQGCAALTDWKQSLREDSALRHWLEDRNAPHASTLSRSLQAADAATVRELRAIAADLSNEVWRFLPGQSGPVILDVDNKGITAQGGTYTGATPGYMSDGDIRRGYRLHLLSVDNHWPLEIEFSGANAPAVPMAMVMLKRLLRRLSRPLQEKIVLRGDSAHGTVWFLRFLRRYPCGYLLKGNNAQTAVKLWGQREGQPFERISRTVGPDLLAMDCGPTRLDGFHHWKDPNGKERRRNVHAQVPRVVIYRQDGAKVPPGKGLESFCLLTTLSAETLSSRQLLELYDQRGGDIENVFCQLDQAFKITHMRSRNFHGNASFMLLTIIAATLTQIIRHEALGQNLPMPKGLKQTLVAAQDSLLRMEYTSQVGYELHRGPQTTYSEPFIRVINISYQHRFRFAA